MRNQFYSTLTLTLTGTGAGGGGRRVMHPYVFFCNGHRSAKRMTLKFCRCYGSYFAALLFAKYIYFLISHLSATRPSVPPIGPPSLARWLPISVKRPLISVNGLLISTRGSLERERERQARGAQWSTAHVHRKAPKFR